MRFRCLPPPSRVYTAVNGVRSELIDRIMALNEVFGGQTSESLVSLRNQLRKWLQESLIITSRNPSSRIAAFTGTTS